MPLPSKALSSDAKITITTLSDLDFHFNDLYDDLHAPETEHTWQKIERALLHIQAITRGGATKYVEFVALLKDAASPINNALLSERTKLSGTAGDLLNSIAPRMAERFEPLVPVFVPTLLLICARTNKVAVKRAERSLHFIVKHCAPPSVVSYLREAIRGKGQGLRAVAAGTLVLVLEHTEKDRLTRRVADIETCIKSGATDSNPEVRQTTKKLFELYVSIWPERVEQFTKPMTPTIRRYLSLPKTGALQVEIPPLTEAPSRSTRPPTSSREEVLFPISHAPQSRTAPAYNFFPDLQKPSASSSASTSTARTGFSMNDATYNKRGLFADQIAAARNARLARMPSFNFDDVAKSDNAPTMKRQPSFDHLRSQPSAAPTTFRVPRFDVVVAPSRQDSNDGGRPRGHGSEAGHMHGDINANAPCFAAASGLHGKSAMLAAYKQAFVGEAGAKPSSSRERHRERPDKPSKGDKRREKTVTVRFEPETDSKDSDSGRHPSNPEGGDEMRRSKSAPSIAIPSNDPPASVPSPADTASTDPTHNPSDWIDSDSEESRPSTPPERHMHAQTPRTGVKASRVPAQRVMQSAVKVSAMRVVATPSAKIAASRVAAGSVSVESSPVPKRSAPPRTPKAPPTKIELVAEMAPAVEPAKEEQEPGKEDKKEGERRKPVEASGKETSKKPAVVKNVPGSSTAIAKQGGKPVPVKSALSASVAAKARLQAGAAKSTTVNAAADNKKIVPKPTSTIAKPSVAKRPVSAPSTGFKPVARPTTSSAPTARVSKPAPTVKPNTTTISAATRPKPTTTAAKPPPTTSVKLPQPVRPSTLTASTASTRNKIVPAATVKNFQPTSVRAKSSIATSLAAKSKLSGVSAKEAAVKRASVALGRVVERQQRRGSSLGVQEKAREGKDKVDAVVEVVQEAHVAQEGVTVAKDEIEVIPGTNGDEAAGQTPDEVKDGVTSEKPVAVETEAARDPTVEVTAEPAVVSIEQISSQVQVEVQEEQASPALEDVSGPSAPVDVVTPVPSAPATPIRTSTSTTATPAAATPTTQPRTPLSSKDVNLPSRPPSKSSTPLKPISVRCSPNRSSPLRRPLLVPVHFDDDAFESEDESEDEASEEVVQLQFARARRDEEVMGKGVMERVKKQLVLGLASDDDGEMGVGMGTEGDETVLLEEVA